MIKLNIELELEDEAEVISLLNYHRYRTAALNFDQFLRAQVKHSNTLSEEQIKFYQRLREQHRQFYIIQGVSFDT